MPFALVTASVPAANASELASLRFTIDPAPRAEQVAPPALRRFGVLGSMEFEIGAAASLRKWRNLSQEVADEAALYRRCEAGGTCSAGVKAWRDMIHDLKDASPRQQLERVNSFVNAAASYSTDFEAFGASDVWVKPSVFFRGVGDCEDYASVKLFTLLELGFDPEQVRLVVVRDVRRGVIHAVVSVELHGEVFILDSLYDKVRRQEVMLRYEPIYSLTTQRRFAHIVTPDVRAEYLAAVLTTRYASVGD